MSISKKNLSAMKRIRQSKKRAERNRAVISRIKTMVKRLEASMESGNADEMGEKLRMTIGTINRAASKGILHKNTASRKVSRLSKQINKVVAASA